MSGPITRRGLLNLLADEGERVLLGIHAFDSPFLLRSSLAFGIGSSEIAGLDRGTPGKVHLAEFRRVERRVVLVELNRKFLASGDAAAVRAGLESFVRSVIWSAPIEREDEQGVIVDATSLVVADHHDILERLRVAGQGDYRLEPSLSYPLSKEAMTATTVTRLSAMVTLTGPGQGSAVRDVTPLPKTLSFVQHLHFNALPEVAMPRRAYHPGSGGYAVAYSDHSRTAREGAEVRIQPRFSLEPYGPRRARRVRRPIVFYVDPAIPEPIRGAIVEGGNWWKAAFESAGFRDAFRVEVLTDGLDLDDPGINTVWWVHRAGRGWSFGRAVIDPRSGEILNGRVLLGSQRVAQVTALAEAVLGPYGQPDEKERLEAVEHVVLARVRQLAAHEIGHALGFVHNFASTHHVKPSVMDYPHPRIRLGRDGAFEVADAYPDGLGPWDFFLVEHAYGEHDDDALAGLREDAESEGLVYVADMDGAASDAAHAEGVPWVLPGDCLEALEEILATRRIAVERFSEAMLPPGRQSGELEERLALLQLLHRHEVEAVARLVGGVRFCYGWAGEGQAGTRPVEAETQWKALSRLAELVRAETIALPPAALETVTPPGVRYGRGPEYLESRHGRVFDPLSAAEAAALLVAGQLLEPARLNRAAWHHGVDPSFPGVGGILDELALHTWRRADPVAPSVVAGRAVQEAANWVILRQVLASLQSPLLCELAKADGLRFLRVLADELDKGLEEMPHEGALLISRFLANPESVQLGRFLRLPPGAPI